MKKHLLLKVLPLCMGMLVISCSTDDRTQPTTPTIGSMNPASGPAGTEITITGENFGTSTDIQTVKIGDVTVPISSISDTEIKVIVPKGVASGTVSLDIDGNTVSGGTFTTTGKPGKGVTLSKTKLRLYPYPHYAKTLEVTSPIGDNTVVWSSDKNTVATVDQNGLVIPISIGTATITATVGGSFAQCAVEVLNGPVTKLLLNKNKLHLYTSEEGALAITTLKGETSDFGIPVWSSDNEDVATVDQQGNVTAVDEGIANITVTVDNASTSCKVTVFPNVYIAGSQNIGNVDVAALWKNGAMNLLGAGATHSNAKAIYVTENNDVYVAGVEVVNGIGMARLWINGVPNDLSDGSNNANALALFVDGTDIYVGGYEIKNGVPGAKVWVNGVALDYSDGIHESMVSSIFVDQGVIYAAGHEATQNGTAVALWENGQITHLDSGRANSVFVAENNVYVAGFEQRNWSYPQVWINGQATDPFGEVDNGVIRSILVMNGNTYAVGTKNGDAAFSISGSPPSNLPYGNANATFAESVYVKGADIYIAGMLWVNQVFGPALWKNGVLINNLNHFDQHDAVIFGDRSLFVK